ncbi:unnamed protein product, partial [Symbiodinium microadriaticum]
MGLSLKDLAADQSFTEKLAMARFSCRHLRDLGSEEQLVEAHALLQEAKKDMQPLLGQDHSETIACREL